MLRRVFERGAYADRAFAAEAAELGPRERALAMQIAYGTVQRRDTLDYVAGRLVGRPLTRLEPPVLAALRLGLFQILYLNGVPDHAAVNESVELAKRASGRGATLVNAVLRRAAAEAGTIVADLDDHAPGPASIKHSVPLWLAERWWSELGADSARQLIRVINEPAESALRVNTLVSTREEVSAALPVPSTPAHRLPEGLVLEGPFDAHSSEMWRRGMIMPQSRASMLVARVLDPPPEGRVLDLCAAPGAKTTHLAALMHDRGRITAVERHPGRARSLRRTCARMKTSGIEVVVGDAGAWRGAKDYDGVLVDPPCSGLGTLRSRPDLRWRASDEATSKLVELQSRILAAGAAATKRGGALVYSVCTISSKETDGVIASFLQREEAFRLDDLGAQYPELESEHCEGCLQLLPHRHETDGFFIARLCKEGGSKV